VIIVVDVDQGRTGPGRWSAGCPQCRGVLRVLVACGSASRATAQRADLVVQPRRARCRSCGATRCFCRRRACPGEPTRPRSSARHYWPRPKGQGYRRIARDLHRPASTVRRWLRRATVEHVEWLRRRGTDRAHLLDAETLAYLEPQRTNLADALGRPRRRGWPRGGDASPRHAAAWTLIGVFTGGRLLGPTPAS